jgi:hypothetical protein
MLLFLLLINEGTFSRPNFPSSSILTLPVRPFQTQIRLSKHNVNVKQTGLMGLLLFEGSLIHV